MPYLTHLLVLLVVSLTAGTVVAYFRIGFWKERFHDQRAIYEDTLDRALGSERDCGALTQEFEYLKQTFSQTLSMLNNRQSVAVMTDAQVQLISQTIAQLVAAQAKDPTKLN